MASARRRLNVAATGATGATGSTGSFGRIPRGVMGATGARVFDEAHHYNPTNTTKTTKTTKTTRILTIQERLDALLRKTPNTNVKVARMICYAFDAYQRRDLLEAHAAYQVAIDVCLDEDLEPLSKLCRASVKGLRREIRTWRLEHRTARRERAALRRIANPIRW